jgi:hypothetical protein
MPPGEDERADEISRMLAAAEAGEPIDMQALLPLVYDQLRRIAQRQMNTERSGYTLQATALVHEAYLKLAGAGLSWKSKSHFYRAAADSMRRTDGSTWTRSWPWPTSASTTGTGPACGCDSVAR